MSTTAERLKSSSPAIVNIVDPVDSSFVGVSQIHDARPGSWTSPGLVPSANTGILRESARSVAAQNTLGVFIFSPNLVSGVEKLQLRTKMEVNCMGSNEAHNSCLLTLMQGFLHVNKRNDLT